MSNRALKITAGLVAVAIGAGLVALAVPLAMPLLPNQVQGVLGGTIHTVPGTLDELLAVAEPDPDVAEDHRVTHAEVDDEYVEAATIWPWTLPQGWGFPKYRGAADTPGRHWNGMGVGAAFSAWSTASLKLVKSGEVTGDAARATLDEVEDAYTVLHKSKILSDASFIDKVLEPLRDTL